MSHPRIPPPVAEPEQEETDAGREDDEREEEEEGGKQEGRGTWKHGAFHVATTIATPAAYAPLPFALASLGWPLGFWGYWAIAFFQQVASLGNNIAIQIAAGSSLKAVYKYFNNDGTLTLQHFIIFFGAFQLFLSQLPNIHSLRWVNAVCTACTIGFAATTIGVAIYNGKELDRKTISYSLQGSSSGKVFGAFNALGAIAFSFGDAMLPEIQNTLREPARKNMYKGVSAAYSIIVLTYWQLAIYGPTYACFEDRTMFRETCSDLPFRNQLQRLIFTSVYVVIVTLIASAMPFFGDFVSICGAIGFTPLDFVFPALAYLKAGRMPKDPKLKVLLQFVNSLIATWYSVVAVLGCIGAIRFITEDVKTYRFFHDM
ncbi:hypothetical protein CDL15_Pgr023761 [Punica granatum]|uniref:Amino acid transporter transmembrane domain-containing protein n=1 Tax=Punica granatum TaxID=22663 RepID=A0A218WS99_PUNGR|nr:hypothetical protein CDL15_Pgr023761 [Punica granatum]